MKKFNDDYMKTFCQISLKVLLEYELKLNSFQRVCNDAIRMFCGIIETYIKESFGKYIKVN